MCYKTEFIKILKDPLLRLGVFLIGFLSVIVLILLISIMGNGDISKTQDSLDTTTVSERAVVVKPITMSVFKEPLNDREIFLLKQLDDMSKQIADLSTKLNKLQTLNKQILIKCKSKYGTKFLKHKCKKKYKKHHKHKRSK